MQDQRFANGTQGRLLHWSPAEVEGSKAVPASHPDISARFVKESAVQKRGQLLPDIDFMDCQVRQENLNIRGDPIMLQLPLVPAYAPSSRQQLCSASIGFSNNAGAYDICRIWAAYIQSETNCSDFWALTVHKTQALSIKHLVLGCVALSFTRAWCAARYSVEESAEEGWSCKRDGDTVCYLCC